MEKRSLAQLFDLTGQAAIVTGGAMGIGQAAALRLAEAGADVMIADLNLEAAEQTVAQIMSAGGKAAVLQADASSVSDATKVVEMIVATLILPPVILNLLHASYHQRHIRPRQAAPTEQHGIF